MIDSETRAVAKSVSIDTQLLKGIGVSNNARLAVAKVILGDPSYKRLAPCRIVVPSVNQAQCLVQTLLGRELHQSRANR